MDLSILGVWGDSGRKPYGQKERTLFFCSSSLSGTPIIHIPGCLKLFSNSLMLFHFLKHFFSLCFIIDSFYHNVYKLTDLFFCNVFSAINPIQGIFHFIYCSFHFRNLTMVIFDNIFCPHYGSYFLPLWMFGNLWLDCEFTLLDMKHIFIIINFLKLCLRMQLIYLETVWAFKFRFIICLVGLRQCPVSSYLCCIVEKSFLSTSIVHYEFAQSARSEQALFQPLCECWALCPLIVLDGSSPRPG